MDWMESKKKHNGSPTPSTHLHPNSSPLRVLPGTPPSPWPEAPLCRLPPPSLHLHFPPTLSLHPSPCSPQFGQTCRDSIPPPPPRSPPRHHSPPPCSRLLRSRPEVVRRRHCAPPPACSQSTRFLLDPAAPIPSLARWCNSISSAAHSRRTSAPRLPPRHLTFRGPCLFSLLHSSPPLQLCPPPSSKGLRPCLDHHPLFILHLFLSSPSSQLPLPPCLWHLPPPSRLSSHLVASHLLQEGNQPSSGSLLMMYWIFQPKHHKPLSSPQVP